MNESGDSYADTSIIDTRSEEWRSKTLIPEICEAAIAMQKEIRVIMNDVCSKGIKGDKDIERAEFRAWEAGMKHQPNWTTVEP